MARGINKEKIVYSIFLLILFICLFVFFYVAHPMYIYDSDDWTYISYSRQAIPSIYQWNPTKVFPETLMPLVSELGIRFVYPITGDYIQSLAFIFGGIIAIIITIYSALGLKVIKTKYSIEGIELIVMGVMFILYHFWPYLVTETQNRHFFYGGNVNCYFNYIIPGLVNAILVLIYIIDRPINIRLDKDYTLKTGGLILLIYLCINSNMFHSIIFISFLLASLLIDFIGEIKKKQFSYPHSLYCVLKNHYFDVISIAVWLICIVLESNGDRAKWSAGTSILNLPVFDTIRLFWQSVKELNNIWMITAICINSLAIAVYVLKKDKNENIDKTFIADYMKILISEAITIIYLILLCAKVTSAYIRNSTVMISWLFWIMLMTLLSLSYLLNKIRAFYLALPLLTYLLVFNVVIDGKTFANNNAVWSYDINTIKLLDDYIINQIIQADQNGLNSVEVFVPVTDSYSWPLDVSYAGNRIMKSLFSHGIISSEIDSILVPDYSVNEKYGIGTSTMPE